MTTPEDRAADGRPLGNLADRVLPRARGPLPDPATVTFPTVVSAVVSASSASVRDPC
jgi:hypothetical protein